MKIIIAQSILMSLAGLIFLSGCSSRRSVEERTVQSTSQKVQTECGPVTGVTDVDIERLKLNWAQEGSPTGKTNGTQQVSACDK